jgi:alkanesulfonate monooxygenase SsuD/methylene tetrahydromethanopterin reductase-like flavin-dependent oxidoreductase (luciferase family)
MVAIIGGEPRRFRPLIELYRQAGSRAGHPPESLKVGIHALGYFADTTKRAADEFYPGYARMFTQIGKERGWPPTRREHFDALLGPTGALLIGDAETVATKILHFNETLGGISRISIQMSPGTVPHAQALHAIDLLGNRIVPLVRKALEKG